MPKLPRISGDEAIRALQPLGFAPVHQSGSHVVIKKALPDGAVGCVVPRHKELAIGTLKSILKQARVDPDEFTAQL